MESSASETALVLTKAATVYLSALFMIRITNKRILGHLTLIDVLVSIILGSTLSRAINGDAPLIPSLLAGALIIFLHWILAILDYHFEFCRWLLRGKPKRLVRNGKILHDQLRSAHLSEDELVVQLRKELNTDSVEKVKEARIETSGSITFVKTD